jgi:protein-L-isoaspartate(D-aspartate) O-methyltransferase
MRPRDFHDCSRERKATHAPTASGFAVPRASAHALGMGCGSEEDAALERARLVERLRAHGWVRDARVLDAFAAVARHRFVPESERDHAYEDRALPLAQDQTISQPTMIAIMLDALECKAGDRALEVGSGSGYAAALLARLVREVDAVEILPALAFRARRVLAELGVDNVFVHVGDGRLGLPERAPFQRILVSAATKKPPPALLDQLARGGRMAAPIGDRFEQRLVIVERTANGTLGEIESVPCVFVPLVGSVTPSPRSAS